MSDEAGITRRWLSTGEPAGRVVERATNKKADRQTPAFLTLKLRHEVGRSYVQCHTCRERQAVLLEDRQLLRQ